MSNPKSEFSQFPSLLPSNLLSKKKLSTSDLNPINLIALLLLFISLLFLITLSIILYYQNTTITQLNTDYTSLSFQYTNLTANISSLKQSNANNLYLLNMLGHELDNSKYHYKDYLTILNELKRTNAQLSKTTVKSKIISKEDRIIISKMINETHPPLLKMVYQASSTHRGDAAEIFHRDCKGIGPFVALIKIEGNNIIGGYSTAVLNEDHDSVTDDKAFLFNFDEREKYMVNTPDRAVSYNNILFINFGSSDLFITDEFFTNRFSYSNFPKSYGNDADYRMKQRLTNGLKLFNVIEFELLQVIDAN